jgi:hypothetical protein
LGWEWWCTLAIPVSQKVEVGELGCKAGLGKNRSLYLKSKRTGLEPRGLEFNPQMRSVQILSDMGFYSVLFCVFCSVLI